MNIHIHGVGGQIQMQNTGGEFACHDLIPVCFFQSGHQKLRFHRTAIDEEGLQISTGPGVCRTGDKTGERIAFPTAVYLGHLGAFSAINAVDCGLQTAGAWSGENLFPVPQHGKGYIGMGQCLHLDSSGDFAALHGVRLHELHPGGGVVEQIPDDDGGAFGAAGIASFYNGAGLQSQTGAGNSAGGFGHKINAADGSDSSQSFTTETAGRNSGQVFSGTELGGGMAQECGGCILGAHTAAVICDPQEGHTAVPDLYGDFGGTGVYGVFQQFFYHGSGALYHLAGGN